MQKQDCLGKFDSIVKGFTKADCIALVHDLDADGISSGALAFLAIERMRGKNPDLVITQPFKTVVLLPKSLAMLRKKKADKLVVVDFAFDQKPESVAEAEKIVGQILVIDHHKDYGYSSAKTFIIKPQFFSGIEPSKYPTAKLAFDLFSRHVDLSSHSWVACVGLIGDNQLEQWKDFVDAAAKAHKTSADEMSRVMEVISAVEVLAPEKLQELLLFIVRAKGPKDVLGSKFSGFSARLEVRVQKLFKEFQKKKELHSAQGLVWFEYRAKRNIKSPVINKVSNELYSDKTVIFVQDKGDGFVDFSARRQDFKIKTNELLEAAVKGFEKAGAGGHVPASAGRIMKKDLPEFKRRIIKLLSP